MAKLSDKEKVKAFEKAGGVEEETPVETPAEEPNPTEEEASQEVEGQTDTEKTAEEIEATETETPNEESPEETSTLTKPFPWLKGETPEEWNEELKKAYENSTNEALTQKKRADDASALIEEAKKVIANTGTEETPAPTAFDIDSHPAIQQLKAQQQVEMVKAFDDFTKSFPQARETDGFSQFEKASAGASQAFSAAFGRTPTYPELFEATANLLKWQPSDKTARKDAAIKEAASGSRTVSTSQPVKSSKVTEAQLGVARRLFPGQTDADIVKDLAQYVN